MSDTEMDYLNSQVINIIRSTGELNETRKISITGGTRASYRAPTAISREILESDDYLIATFHYYRPFLLQNLKYSDLMITRGELTMTNQH